MSIMPTIPLTGSLKRARTGSSMVTQVLEKLGIKYVFGIPGVHNNELYRHLSQSRYIEPILVSHELHGAYMADAIGRTCTNQIGTLLTVPGAGITHAASGIAEAHLAGIPMLVIATGVRSDQHHHFQLHDIDQQQLLTPISKHYIRINQHHEITPALFKAYHLCQADEPGPVIVEIPANLLIQTGAPNPKSKMLLKPSEQKATLKGVNRTSTLSSESPSVQNQFLSPQKDVTLNLAIDMLLDARRPGIYLGWGARHAVQQTIELAERLYAPVATTLQGLSAFPHDHPLHTGLGFGPSAVPPAVKAFSKCDCLLAIGTRFSELATAGYSLPVPKKLIHIDINPNVFNRNYPATFTLAGDAAKIVPRMLELLRQLNPEATFQRQHSLVEQISKEKAQHKRTWLNQINHPDRVNPAFFFSILDNNSPKEMMLVADDGHHTFLTAELMPIYYPNHFISPTDFNSMGYCVPAVIGAKLANPNSVVAGIVGDGAFRMTCMEIATATKLKLGCIWYVFNDGELTQISHIQRRAYGGTFSTDLPTVNLEKLAQSVGAHYLVIRNNSECIKAINSAQKLADENRPVVVDVRIDNSRESHFTKGIVATQFKRLPLRDRARLISRAVKSKLVKESVESH